tara:strand:- start:224 stop:442 length:219 start_codon:yes stop_codon:yes gene_type:complete
MGSKFKMFETVKRKDNPNQKGKIYKINFDNQSSKIDLVKNYLVVWQPLTESDFADYGYVNEICKEHELERIK